MPKEKRDGRTATTATNPTSDDNRSHRIRCPRQAVVKDAFAAHRRLADIGKLLGVTMEAVYRPHATALSSRVVRTARQAGSGMQRVTRPRPNPLVVAHSSRRS